MLKAVIFDLDGTILINNEAYDVAFCEVLKRLDVQVGEEFDHTGGIGVKGNWRSLIEQYDLDPDLSLDDLEKQTQEVYVNNLDKIKMRDGFFDLVNDIHTSNIKTALATGNDLETTKKVIVHFGMESCFDAIATVYEAGKPKPEPDIFLLAAKRLNVDPQECVVIEDSAAGIEAAGNAKMAVVSVHDYNFTELTLEKLQSMVDNQ
jgi:HAD superfamily hydrolase (TIGR01509 family)